MTGFNISLIVAAAAVAVSFFYGLFTRNYSTVDRLWSILPPVYLMIWFRDISFNPRYIVAASGTLHITGFGAVLLIALFAGSTVFVESVTLSKYPEYGEWRRLSSVWVPFRSLVKKKQGDEFLSSDK